MHSVVEDVGNSHLVLSEGTGFIGADAGSRSKSLNGFEVLDEDHLLGHSLGGKSKRNGDGSEETFWDVSDDDTNGEDQVSDQWVVVDHTEDEENNTEGNGDSRDNSNESFDFNSEWGLGRLGGGGEVSNQTNDSCITSSDADTLTGSGVARATEESGILGLKDILDWIKIWVNFNIVSLSGEGGIVHLKVVGLEDNNITWDVLSTDEEDEITWDDIFGVNLLFLTVSDNVGNWWDEVFELCHHFGGFGGLCV